MILEYQKKSYFPQIIFIIGLGGLLSGDNIRKDKNFMQQEKKLKI